MNRQRRMHHQEPTQNIRLIESEVNARLLAGEQMSNIDTTSIIMLGQGNARQLELARKCAEQKLEMHFKHNRDHNPGELMALNNVLRRANETQTRLEQARQTVERGSQPYSNLWIRNVVLSFGLLAQILTLISYLQGNDAWRSCMLGASIIIIPSLVLAFRVLRHQNHYRRAWRLLEGTS